MECLIIKVIGVRKSDWCKKNCSKLINEWLYGNNEEEKIRRKNVIIEKMSEYGFDEKIKEFENRYDNYEKIVMSEFV